MKSRHDVHNVRQSNNLAAYFVLFRHSLIWRYKIEFVGFDYYLIGVIFSEKYDFHVAGFTNKRLRLFSFATEHSRFTTIRYVRFRISIHNLHKQTEKVE